MNEVTQLQSNYAFDHFSRILDANCLKSAPFEKICLRSASPVLVRITKLHIIIDGFVSVLEKVVPASEYRQPRVDYDIFLVLDIC